MLAKQETSLLHRHQSSACSRLPAAPCASVAASRSLNQQCRRQRTMCMAAWEGEQQQVPSSEVLGLPPPPALHQQQQRQHQHQQQQQQQPDGTPHSTLQRVLEVVRAGNLDGMLEFCSDEVIDKLLALKKQTGSPEQVHFCDILKANSEDLLYLDTFAVRNLVLTAPRSMRVLSAMQVTPEKYLQRCAIVSPSGEECVLTFNVVLEEALECQYKSVLVSKKWMLKGVTGECHSDELPSHPSPSFPPEAVVEAQLAALRECRVAPVFAHASPENKASSGPVERFAFMLQHSPAYSPLMGHVRAETVQRLQPSDSTYMEVVKVYPRAQQRAAATEPCSTQPGSRQQHHQAQAQAQEGEPVLFMWIVSRQPGSSSWANCWMTDAVQLVNVMPAQPPSSSSSSC